MKTAMLEKTFVTSVNIILLQDSKLQVDIAYFSCVTNSRIADDLLFNSFFLILILEKKITHKFKI